MSPLKLYAMALVAGTLLSIVVPVESFAQARGGPTGTEEFIDAPYGYSVRIPRGWGPAHRASTADQLQRLGVSTPTGNRLFISVRHLGRAITRHAEFERIAHDHVDPVIKQYLTFFKSAQVLGDQKEDKSNADAMKFWQGTSFLNVSMQPGMLLSLHAVRYGSNVMVNVVYVSFTQSQEEVRAVDVLMNSLSLARK